MEPKDRLAKLPGALLPWYEKNKRQLPWRQNRDPYHIWISEIMLQQTRVEAVKGYYSRFLNTLPTISALAECDDETLYKLWEGLGYYNRVRNLRKAAQQVMQEHKGIFPREYAQILALSGIGEYTAGAICSIAYDQKVPAVDGNVLRVAARLLDTDTPVDVPAFKKEIRTALEAVYPDESGAFTQALMELGATVCLPNGEPRCEVCPCRGFCEGQHRWQELPVKLPKKAKKQENRTVFVLRCGDRYAIEKRPNRGLLAGLWQFPNESGHLSAEEAILWAESRGLHPRNVERSIDRHHIFTHIRWDMRCWFLEVDEPAGGFTWLTLEEIDGQAALPTAFRQFREEI